MSRSFIKGIAHKAAKTDDDRTDNEILHRTHWIFVFHVSCVKISVQTILAAAVLCAEWHFYKGYPILGCVTSSELDLTRPWPEAWGWQTSILNQ